MHSAEDKICPSQSLSLPYSLPFFHGDKLQQPEHESVLNFTFISIFFSLGFVLWGLMVLQKVQNERIRPYPFCIFANFKNPDLGGAIGKKGPVNSLNRDMKTMLI